MSGHSSYVPSNGIMRWLDARLPLPRMVYDSFVAYPVPRNLNYAYTFGGILALFLAVQILTGVVLAMHYAASSALAFESVEKIMRGENVAANIALIEDLAELMRDGSLCAMGGLTPAPVLSAIRLFPEDFERKTAPEAVA